MSGVQDADSAGGAGGEKQSLLCEVPEMSSKLSAPGSKQDLHREVEWFGAESLGLGAAFLLAC